MNEMLQKQFRGESEVEDDGDGISVARLEQLLAKINLDGS